MDSIAKKGRFFLLAAAIFAWIGAFGIVFNQVVSVVLSRIVTENIGAVLGTYNQITAVLGALLGGAVPCVLFLLAASHTDGRTKRALFAFACGTGASALLTLLHFSLRTPESSYLMNMLSAGVTSLCVILGDLFLTADHRTCGTIKGIALCAAVFSLLTALIKITANFCGYQYVMTYEHDPWIRLLSLASNGSLFVSIIAAVLDGTKLMLLYALPAVRPQTDAAEQSADAKGAESGGVE